MTRVDQGRTEFVVSVNLTVPLKPGETVTVCIGVPQLCGIAGVSDGAFLSLESVQAINGPTVTHLNQEEYSDRGLWHLFSAEQKMAMRWHAYDAVDIVKGVTGPFGPEQTMMVPNTPTQLIATFLRHHAHSGNVRHHLFGGRYRKLPDDVICMRVEDYNVVKHAIKKDDDIGQRAASYL